jgi:creatinine amidohydrolase/Fe(II)-dependent formamide hydrolase-like protein
MNATHFLSEAEKNQAKEKKNILNFVHLFHFISFGWFHVIRVSTRSCVMRHGACVQTKEMCYQSMESVRRRRRLRRRRREKKCAGERLSGKVQPDPTRLNASELAESGRSPLG